MAVSFIGVKIKYVLIRCNRFQLYKNADQ